MKLRLRVGVAKEPGRGGGEHGCPGDAAHLRGFCAARIGLSCKDLLGGPLGCFIFSLIGLQEYFSEGLRGHPSLGRYMCSGAPEHWKRLLSLRVGM